METVRYCFDKYCVSIYDINGKEIGTGRYNANKIIEIYSGNKIGYAHICNTKTFKCHRKDCEHLNSGEISFMTIKTQFSFKRNILILFNEQFVATKDFDSLENNSLMKISFIPYNERWTKFVFTSTLLHCNICQMYFEIAKNTIKHLL